VAQITAAAAEAGRDLNGFEWFAFVFVNVDGDGDQAREETAAFIGGTYRQDFSAMVSSVAVAGTPAEVTAQLQAFVDAGARHFILSTATRTRWWDVVRCLTGEVLPALTDTQDGP
jgi:alkanesulfonate monooxygenase SsuD/methylene tetrahydromethanopterin reductase-like flavin-dependent oxidoreductase (luciferase family)